ncbi:type II toxin-antitoxin system VapC family toxin [Candidatus Thiosymbion oneisti]|uniref:type II toxin-antitoxin system VapC family toxin n=1 Tax=Candidatus Thiosymbion oneisti TaxID=589554 RepID=UPI000A6A4C75|nr:PIN domain-containing protein [Candidatus Thiosymbion oneisti]
MKIYFDVCCLNRPFDDQTQDRIRLESEAILMILKHIEENDWQWISSDAVLYEIHKTPNDERRERLKSLNSRSTSHVPVNRLILARSAEIQIMGFKTYDALHLACAEKAAADVLLSTDDRLLKKAETSQHSLKINIDNPLTWLQKVVQ